jgi:hypothetical protein
MKVPYGSGLFALMAGEGYKRKAQKSKTKFQLWQALITHPKSVSLHAFLLGDMNRSFGFGVHRGSLRIDVEVSVARATSFPLLRRIPPRCVGVKGEGGASIGAPKGAFRGAE